MAQRKAQIIIDVDDRSLIELNDEIKQLETSIQSLKVGTKEWQAANVKLGDLKTKFQAATNEARKLQGQVEKISGAEQLRSIAKLGAGMVGTFTAVSGSIKLLGINAEAFDEMTAKATTLMSIMGGLNQISETFSKQNLAGLASLGKGFTTLVKTVKTASTAMKAALISTGIGALVVGVGLLIANWDKLKNLVSGANKERIKAAENDLSLFNNILKQSEARLNADREALTLIKEKNKYNYNAYEVARQEFELAGAEAIVAAHRINVLREENDLIDVKLSSGKKIKEEEEKELKRQKEINRELIRGLEFSHSIAAIKLLEAERYMHIAERVHEINEQIRKNELAITRMSAELYKQNDVYLLQIENIDLQIESINKIRNIQGEITKENQDQIDILKAQRDALEEQERIRLQILFKEIDQLGYERSLQDAISDNAETYKEINRFLSERIDYFEGLNKGHEDEINAIKNEYDLYVKLRKEREELVNFDKKGLDIFNEKYAATVRMNIAYNDIRENLKEQLDIQRLDKGLFIDKINLAAEEIGYAERLYQATLGKLNNEKVVLSLKKESAVQTIKEIEWSEKIVQNQLKYYETQLRIAQYDYDHAESLEEQKVKLEELMAVEAKIDELTAQSLDNQQAIVDAKRDIQNVDEEILKTEQDINAAAQDKLNTEKEVTEELAKQAEWHERANDFLNQYAQEIQAVRDILMNSMALMAGLQERKADEAQERIDELQEQLNELDKQEEERYSRLDEYEELLKDANGQRYDELLALIELEQNAKINSENEIETQRAAIEAKIKDEENKKLAAEARAAEWRKAAALVDAVVQGALAVIKALPNVFLAAATGVAAATGAATIAAQKTPDIPEGYAIGGFTPKTASNDTPVGVVHGNEYVAPAFVTQSAEAQSHIAALERQRMRGYATGGAVMPATNTTSTDYIDYERLGAVILNGLKTMPNPVVSVLKINEAQREVAVTKKLAGL